jgi:hypothetical protein
MRAVLGGLGNWLTLVALTPRLLMVLEWLAVVGVMVLIVGGAVRLLR